jgi:UDP-N-acetylglucosamine--dolichyl-phosphate N-acetylglucosaminephosphotransferase
MEFAFLVFIASFAFTFAAVPWFIPRLLKAKISGRDMNKKRKNVVAEMGGLVVVGGFLIGVLLAIGLYSFGIFGIDMDLPDVLAGLSVVLAMGLIGIIDDLLDLRQGVKAVLPLFAALPLVAINAGVTNMDLPFFGTVDFGLLYPLVLVPLAITGAANATNMLAGFNGLEAGLGVIMCSTLGFVALGLGNTEGAVLSFAMAGALLAFLFYNWYPARILIGDVGTLSIGAVVAVSVIVGDMEKAGVILIIPFVLELVLKARGGFKQPSWCDFKNGRLYCRDGGRVYGLGRLIMYLHGGVSERRLVFSIFALEILMSLIVFYSYFGSGFI